MTYDFAGSGSTLNTSIVDGTGYDVICEIDEAFLPYFEELEALEVESSLFVVWIGINDIYNSSLNEDDSVHPVILDSFRFRFETLYDAGTRNFLLLNVPRLESAPRVTGSRAAENRIPLVGNVSNDGNSRSGSNTCT